MRLVSFDRYRRPIVQIGDKWYGKDRMTKAEKIQAERLLLADDTPLPLFNGEFFYWPDAPDHLFNEDDTVADLEMIFDFSEADAKAICETSRCLYRIQQYARDI